MEIELLKKFRLLTNLQQIEILEQCDLLISKQTKPLVTSTDFLRRNFALSKVPDEEAIIKIVFKCDDKFYKGENTFNIGKDEHFASEEALRKYIQKIATNRIKQGIKMVSAKCEVNPWNRLIEMKF